MFYSGKGRKEENLEDRVVGRREGRLSETEKKGQRLYNGKDLNFIL